MTSLSRRTFLKLLSAGAATTLIPSIARADLSSPSPALIRLQDYLLRAVDGREIGLDLRRVDDAGYEFFRIQHNADELYPVASCFKSFLVLYYFWNTPPDEWDDAPGSTVYSVGVFSNNTLTETLLNEVAARIDYYGNAIEKFNDFLIFTLGMQNGLFRWVWNFDFENESDLLPFSDRRFRPSETRYVEVYGARYEMDNLFTAADLSQGYALMLQPNAFPDAPQANAAIAATLELLSIPAEDYQSPFERVFPDGYIGKDGVLPAEDSAVGRVINDAGIVTVNTGRYIFSYMCAGEGEFGGLNILRQIATYIEDYESEAS